MINVGEGHWEKIEFVWKPQCTEHLPCTHDIAPHSSWYPPAVLMVSSTVLNTPGLLNNDILQCAEHPPVYCTDIMQGVTESLT